MSKDNTFTCANCLETFGKDWTDEEAAAEYDEVFPDAVGAVDVVCDDCYNKMITVMPPQRGVNYETSN